MGKIKLLKDIKTRKSHEFAKICREAEILRNINERAAKIESLRAQLNKIEILEEEAIVNGEKLILLSVDGFPEGVCIHQNDLDSGAVTLQQGYTQMAELVERGQQ